MKFQFDPNQDFQLEAIRAIVDIFEGQNRTGAENVAGLNLFGIYPNTLSLTKEDVLNNVKKIQERNILKENGIVDDFDFSIEMETGTGKTYVYLRTIFELNKTYGWKKFIILVPSVAIREGVMKSLKNTKEHFADLYDNTPYSYYEYKSKNISQVKHFADSNVINIMVMTTGAFNKDANVLYAERDQMQGEQPVTYIQKTNPILILDEPQNMEGEATKKSLENFNSLFRLRYSATHKNPYNIVYQLTPYDAYQKGLVKKIDVFSVTDDDSGFSLPHMALIEARPAQTVSGIKAKLEVAFIDGEGKRKIKPLIIKKGEDVADKTKNQAYVGYVVTNIEVDAPDFGSEARVHFENGFVLTRDNQVKQNKTDIFREQISNTIKLHFEKREKHRNLGIKVLSLFFIDKVANYVENDGVIRKIFTEEFNRLKVEFNLDQLNVEKTHNGYFAKKKDGSYIEQDFAIERNDEAYELIMKDKERLLSFDEPVEFIFSHSALREGWDNPNIFNICTLNETHSTVKKRQEIGRGMRLCVNQEGERIFDKRINLLSVVANVSYADYVAGLQGEFNEDGIYKAPPVPGNAKRKRTIKLKKDFQKDENFMGLWKNISKKTRYVVHIDTDSLVEKAALSISELRLKKPLIRVERAGIDISAEGVKGIVLGAETGHIVVEQSRFVDCIELIKAETKLTRSTVADILLKSGNTKAFINNPEKFCIEVSRIIKQELARDYVDQISYEILEESYKLDDFKNIESYKDSAIDVDRSIYDAIVYDSSIEKRFALSIDADERIKLFIKLPGWFKVNTPVGDYNPDWAIVTVKRDLEGNESSEKIYFVIETKGDIENLRPTEKAKIESAKKHFEVIKVNYKEVENYQQFVSNCLD
ncbi:MAG: DEAD/DEAH box helicase family protein [Patescibacteria group bacterium]